MPAPRACDIPDKIAVESLGRYLLPLLEQSRARKLALGEDPAWRTINERSAVGSRQ